jgi:hypothetical protein
VCKSRPTCLDHLICAGVGWGGRLHTVSTSKGTSPTVSHSEDNRPDTLHTKTYNSIYVGSIAPLTLHMQKAPAPPSAPAYPVAITGTTASTQRRSVTDGPGQLLTCTRSWEEATQGPKQISKNSCVGRELSRGLGDGYQRQGASVTHAGVQKKRTRARARRTRGR